MMASAGDFIVQADKSGIADDAVSVVVPDATVYVPLEELIDFEQEKERLTKEELADRAELYLCGHEHMAEYAGEETVDVICFNFGYLPGGDHKVATHAETSMQAILQGLKLLKRGGMMSLCIYSGGDTGFEEKDAILNLLRTLPSREYTVIANEYYNRKNNPPMPVFIFKS